MDSLSDYKSWAASEIQRRSIDELFPYARNARTHSDAQVAQIAASIREFGWTIPVLIDEQGSLIAGHGRVMAARLLGITEIPAMVAKGWTEDQKRAYVLLDNQLPQNAGWDMDLLKVELEALQANDFNIDLVGFDDKFLGELLRADEAASIEPDEEATDSANDESRIIHCPACGHDFSVLEQMTTSARRRKPKG